jgi:hypothetical protein
MKLRIILVLFTCYTIIVNGLNLALKTILNSVDPNTIEGNDIIKILNLDKIKSNQTEFEVEEADILKHKSKIIVID